MKKLLLWMIALTAVAQTPAFDVASIKANKSVGGMSSMRATPGLIVIENASLRKVILTANGIPDDRDYVLVGPDWLRTEHFDIQAKFPASTTPPEMRRMMQALLADRFKLTMHSETRQLPTFALTVSKSGLKIHAVEEGQPKTSSGPGKLEATKITMQKLADLLGRITGQPVTDATGLKEVFDFKLEWSPLEVPKMTMQDDGEVGGLSISSALEEQVGLKLVGRKGPVEVLVIDHLEKVPTENYSKPF
jgi:uncharacterized protein (TIGR03435 family)